MYPAAENGTLSNLDKSFEMALFPYQTSENSVLSMISLIACGCSGSIFLGLITICLQVRKCVSIIVNYGAIVKKVISLLTST